MDIGKRANPWAYVVALTCIVILCTFVPAPSAAVALPEGRVYEMVSPPYKEGFDAVLQAISPEGESVAFESYGVFAHLLWAQQAVSNYVAHRGPAGWATTALSPPPAFAGIYDFSANLQYTLTAGSLEATKEGNGGETIGTEFLLHRTDAPDTPEAWGLNTWEVADGRALTLLHEEPYGKGGFEGESANLCHIILGNAEGPLLPEAEGTSRQLYDFSTAPAGGCSAAGGRSLRLVSVKNTPGPHGEPEPIDGQCLVEAGDPNSPASGGTPGGVFNRFADGGEEIFFTPAFASGCTAQQLFVRLGGERTLEVSRPLSEACDQETELPCPKAATRGSANFMGASEDGLKVFFTTAASLTGGPVGGDNLYMAVIGCPPGEPDCAVAGREVTSLVQVSQPPVAGEVAEVQGVVRIAQDGSRVYFVARGVLGEGANAQGQAPRKGADNLYVYDTLNDTTAFIDDLAGSDADLWGTRGQEAQSNVCYRSQAGECVGQREPGRYLVFATYARLTGDDTDNAKDLYRYDAQTGVLERVSLGEDGYDANGNRDDEPGGGNADATIPFGGIHNGQSVSQEYEMGSRAISEDGSRIVFATAEPLSPEAVNGLVNVYEWHEGRVSLISSGASSTDDANPVISASGRDVFFQTSAQLVPQDTDENVDVYDARLGGGFPSSAAQAEECRGDACQGPLTNPAPLLIPGSVSQAPGENFATPPPAASATPKKAAPGCRRGFVKKKNKCVTAKRSKRAKAKRSTHRKGSR